MTVKIYLIRHGQTVFNVEHKISGQIETDLTPAGREQALQCALDLLEKDANFDVVLCSTLKRAVDTTEIITDILPAPTVYDDDLREFCNGIFEGVAIEDLQQMKFNPPYKTAGFTFDNGDDLRQAYSSFDPCYDNLSYPEGETKAEARERFMSAIKRYIDAHTDVKNLGVVAHGAVIRFMLLKICPQTVTEKIKNAETRVVFYDRKNGCFYAE